MELKADVEEIRLEVDHLDNLTWNILSEMEYTYFKIPQSPHLWKSVKVFHLFCLLYRQVIIANLLVFLILQFPILGCVIEKADICTEISCMAIPKKECKGQLRKSHQSALCNNSPTATYI